MTGRQPHEWAADLASIGAIIGSMMGVLPAIATLMAIAWYAILIYESRTVQRMRKAKEVVEVAAEKAQDRVAVAAHEARVTVLDAANEARQVLDGTSDPKI